MCENNIPTLEFLNNCDELRDFMMYHFDDPLNGTANFQGDVVELPAYVREELIATLKGEW